MHSSGVEKREEKIATITQYKPNLLEIQTESSTPAILLLTDSFYPGWKATIDDKPSEILRANYTFRALVVPQGNHKVIFSYKPGGFNLGAGISIASTLFLLFITTFRAVLIQHRRLISLATSVK